MKCSIRELFAHHKKKTLTKFIAQETYKRKYGQGKSFFLPLGDKIRGGIQNWIKETYIQGIMETVSRDITKKPRRLPTRFFFFFFKVNNWSDHPHF